MNYVIAEGKLVFEDIVLNGLRNSSLQHTMTHGTVDVMKSRSAGTKIIRKAIMKGSIVYD